MACRHRKAADAAALLGNKTILNEFIAYLKLAALPDGVLSSALAAHHAVCNVRVRQFRLGRIMIAGVSGMIPERRRRGGALSLKALVSGTIAIGHDGMRGRHAAAVIYFSYGRVA